MPHSGTRLSSKPGFVPYKLCDLVSLFPIKWGRNSVDLMPAKRSKCSQSILNHFWDVVNTVWVFVKYVFKNKEANKTTLTN